MRRNEVCDAQKEDFEINVKLEGAELLGRDARKVRSDGLGNGFPTVAPDDDAVEGVLDHHHLVTVKESEQFAQQT